MTSTTTTTPSFLAAGLCPIGQVDFVSDTYTNLDTRTIEGYDIGVYYDVETGIGRFALQVQRLLL